MKLDLSDESIDKLAKSLSNNSYQFRKLRSERELRNVKLLLEKYRFLENHIDVELPSIEDEISDSSYREKLSNDELSIYSLLGYRVRSKEMIIFLNEILERYRLICTNGEPEEQRKFKVINSYFISDHFLNKNELAEKYHVDRKTIDRDVKKAIGDLSVMIFGIDGLNDMSK